MFSVCTVSKSPAHHLVSVELFWFCYLSLIPVGQSVLPTPGKIIRPGHHKNSAAGRKNLPYPAAACMIIVDLCFFYSNSNNVLVTQRQINVKSNVIQYLHRDTLYILTWSFFFFTTSEKKELRKSFWPFFGPFWQIFDKNSAANLLGRTYFLPAPFELCGRKFGQLATLWSIRS